MINTDPIEASGSDIRSLAKEAVVEAPVSDVWAAWASGEGIAAWWNPPEARVDLRVGGPFEIMFLPDAPDGDRGSEGCQFLAYVPDEMVSFTWNAPPHLALRKIHTWVVITFTPVSKARTHVRLVHTGFLEGPDWDDYRDYFVDAWGYVLDLLTAHWTNE
ncbi:MAG: SRPBCC domain-containing protein [Actinomycetota bacterium]